MGRGVPKNESRRIEVIKSDIGRRGGFSLAGRRRDPEKYGNLWGFASDIVLRNDGIIE